MADEHAFLIIAKDQTNQYLHLVDEAMASVDPDEMRRHIQDVMPFGQMMIDNLEEALSVTEDSEVADCIEEAMYHMVVSMDQGDQGLDVTEDEMLDFVSEMRKHAEQSATYLSEALGVAA